MVEKRPSGPAIARRGILALLAGIAAEAPALRAEAAHLRLGVAPFAGAFRLAREGAKLTGALQPCLAAPVAVRTAPDFATFLARLLQRRYDLALAPAHFAAAAARRDYLPVCDLDCGDAIVVFGRVEPGRAPALAEVERATLLLPDPLSLVSLATLAELQRRGLRPRGVRHLRAMRDVIELVEEGRADMGAVPLALYEEEEAEERARGEPPECVEIARLPVPLRKTLLLAPWLAAHARCVQAVVEQVVATRGRVVFGVHVRRIVEPDLRLHAELARLLPETILPASRPAGESVRG